jgi:GNAT superfamily N-acetyltransferase
MPPAPLGLTFHPVTPARLPDLTAFMQAHGKFRYCACMRWRMRSTDFSSSTKQDRVETLEALVREGEPVGVLAYLEQEPVGWCSVAPRETHAALERYRALPRIDDKPVWSVVCFFVSARIRRSGATRGLLKAAVDYAAAQGARDHRRLSGRAMRAPLRLYGLGPRPSGPSDSKTRPHPVSRAR